MPVYCGCCALIGSLLTWPWLALKIDITASLDSGPLSFSLCAVLNEKGDRRTVWKRIKRAEDFEFSSAGDFAIERKKLHRAEDLPPKTEGLAPLHIRSKQLHRANICHVCTEPGMTGSCRKMTRTQDNYVCREHGENG